MGDVCWLVGWLVGSMLFPDRFCRTIILRLLTQLSSDITMSAPLTEWVAAERPRFWYFESQRDLPHLRHKLCGFRTGTTVPVTTDGPLDVQTSSKDLITRPKSLPVPVDATVPLR